MVTGKQVIETKSLPQGTSTHLVELVALTRALESSKGHVGLPNCLMYFD